MGCPIGCGARRCTHALSGRIRTRNGKGMTGCTSASERRKKKR